MSHCHLLRDSLQVMLARVLTTLRSPKEGFVVLPSEQQCGDVLASSSCLVCHCPTSSIEVRQSAFSIDAASLKRWVAFEGMVPANARVNGAVKQNVVQANTDFAQRGSQKLPVIPPICCALPCLVGFVLARRFICATHMKVASI